MSDIQECVERLDLGFSSAEILICVGVSVFCNDSVLLKG